MSKKTEEELNSILANVKQITETYAKAIPTQEEIENIRRAYADVVPNAQNTADLIKAYAHLTPQPQDGAAADAFGRIVDEAVHNGQAQAYPFAPSPENIEKITEAVNRLMPPEELQKMSEAAERMKNNPDGLPGMIDDLVSLAQMSGSLRSNPAATNELLALQQALMGRQNAKPRSFDPESDRAERRRGVWKAVYIALGIVIIVGLILTLAVPGFKEAVLGWLR